MEESIIPENTVHVERVGNLIHVTANHRDRDLISLVPGARWNKDARVWRCPLSWAACLQLRGVFGSRLQVGPELNAWAAQEYHDRVEPCMRLREADDVPGWDEPNLTGRQKAGALFLSTAQYALIGDEVGAGKTRQVIFALERRQSYPALIIATKGGKAAWSEEFAKVAPHRKVQVISGGAAARRKQFAEEADVYIIHWQIARLHTRLAGYGYIKLEDKEKELKEINALKLKAAIADESHRMQDPKSKQTRAAWAIFDQVKDAPDTMRITMSGTPIDRSMEQAWPQLRAIAPHEHPSKTAYVDRYALQVWTPFGFNEIAGILPEHKEEFFKIVDPRFIRRPRQIVVPNVPEPIYMPPRVVELAGKQKKAYEQMRDGLLAEVENGTIMAKNPLIQLGRLRQFAAAYAELIPDDTGRSKDGFRVQLTEPSVVIDELIDCLQGEYRDVPALIFAESRQLIELASARMAKEGFDHGLITGLVNEHDRTRVRHQFQDGELPYTLMTMAAGGESLTFTAAKACFFLERSFSLRINKQAEGRAPRPGQTDRVMMVDIVVEDTVYEDTREALIVKGESFEEFVRDGDQLERFRKALHVKETKKGTRKRKAAEADE